MTRPLWRKRRVSFPWSLRQGYATASKIAAQVEDLKQIPLRCAKAKDPTTLDTVVSVRTIPTPTEVDHYQLFRVIDVHVSPKTEDLGRVTGQIDRILAKTTLPEGVRVELRGSVQNMRSSFKSFGIGLLLANVLVYLILVAQFASFLDPFIILPAVPPGLAGVLLFLLVTGTTLNVMSLMGAVKMVGIVVSNSILIVEFTRRPRHQGKPLKEAAAVQKWGTRFTCSRTNARRDDCLVFTQREKSSASLLAQA